MKVPSFSGSTVFVIGDDACHQEALKELLESVGLHVELFAWGNAFLESPIPDTAGCIVLDVRFPLNGLKFQSDLAKAKIRVPIIFLTGQGDIPMAVRAMKAGAVLSDQTVPRAGFIACCCCCHREGWGATCKGTVKFNFKGTL